MRTARLRDDRRRGWGPRLARVSKIFCEFNPAITLVCLNVIVWRPRPGMSRETGPHELKGSRLKRVSDWELIMLLYERTFEDRDFDRGIGSESVPAPEP